MALGAGGNAPTAADWARLPTLRARLLLLVASVALPFGLFIAWTLHDWYRRDHARATADLLTTVRTLTVLPDQELGMAEAVLQGLSGSAALAAGDLDTFLLRARALARPDGESIALYDPRGGLVVATGPAPDRLPPGQALSGRWATALVAQRVGVLLPTPDASGRVLGLWLPPDRLGQMLRERRLPAGWTAAILDRDGVLVGRTQRAVELIGRPALPAGLARNEEGFTSGIRNLDGELSLVAFARAPASGYAVVVSVPQAGFEAALARDLARAAAVATALLLTGVSGALVLSRRVRTALAALADQARAGSGLPAAGGLREVREVSVALAAAARERDAATAALRAQEARYRALVEGISEFVWLADPLGRLRPEGAAAWARLTGLPETTLAERGWFEALLPEERGVADALWRAALAAGIPFGGEWRVHRAPSGPATDDAVPGETAAAAAVRPGPHPGEVAWLSVRAVPLPDGMGGVREWVGLSADVTEVRAASRALAESETRLRLALEGGGLGSWDYDPVSGRGTWSAGVAATLGLPATESFSRRRGIAAVHPQDRRRLRDALATARRAGDSFTAELRAARPAADGGPVWIELRARVLRDEDGRATRLVGVLRDVTERERAAVALREREAELARAQRIGRLGGFEVDLRDGPGRYRNRRSPEYLALHGLSPEGADEPHGAWVERLHPEDRARTEHGFAAAVAPGDGPTEYAAEYRIITPAGEVRWISALAEVERDASGRALRLVGVHIDVSALRRAEAALRESEARFRTLAEAMPQLVWSTDASGRNDYRNARWYEYSGLAPAEVGRAGWGGILHPDDAARVHADWARSLATGQDYAVEYRLRGGDGVYRWFLGKAVPLRDPQGRIQRWFGTSTDISEIVAAREARAAQAAELERLVAERTAALVESEQRLAQAQKMEALGRLAGGVAHDVNNVLQAVLGGARLIATRSQDPARVAWLAGLVAEQAERGAAVARRLLGFARRGELSAAPQDAASLLAELREVLGHTLGGTVSVRLAAEPSLPPVLADRAQLETVLVNLAINARDAMPEGGEVTLSAAAVRVEADGHGPAGLAAGDYLRLSVADTGTGMSAAVLARVTEPFFTTKPRGEGTGLGLAMARGFAEQSGGALRIDSTPGRGTVVSLWLPQAGSPVIAAAPPAAGAEPAPGARLLLVDDEPAVRAVLAGGLEARGHAVLVADGPAAALELLRSGAAVDAIVSDLAMPGGMDGLGLLAAARSQRPRLPGLLVTGYADEATCLAVERATAGGPTALLRKPVSAEALLEALAALLEAPDAG